VSESEFNIARLRELQVEAERALEAAGKAFARLERAVAKIDGEIERAERPTEGGARGQRGAFALPLLGMAYIAIWLAYEGNADCEGVSEDEFVPYLEALTHSKGGAADLSKVMQALDGARGHQVAISRGAYRLLPFGLKAVVLHWPRVTGIPVGRSPPSL
jgi:hypothetical protein